jgi:hypothetical protein
MDDGRGFDVQLDEGGGIHIVEKEHPNTADPLHDVAVAAVREEIAAQSEEKWAPWITKAAVAYILANGRHRDIDVSDVVVDEITKRLPYQALFAAVGDADSEVVDMLRALVSRVVSPMGTFFAGDKVCDIVPRDAPGED